MTEEEALHERYIKPAVERCIKVLAGEIKPIKGDLLLMAVAGIIHIDPQSILALPDDL